ncbi:MAG: peptidoglycan bridge formation glycyltransferase FemA/FemB family protein [Candidatus Saccharimonadales bacterium]
MISIQICENREEWDDYIVENDGHPLQLWGWGETKAAHGWSAERLFAYDIDKNVIGATQILVRKLPWPFKALVYVPRGPVTTSDNTAEFLDALANYARSQYSAVAISIEPDWAELPVLSKGWQKGENTILLPSTLILDLTKTEDELLASMSKKTRQYIRKSGGGDGVGVQQIKGAEYFEACLAIYSETATRAGFAIHGDDYYRDVFKNLGEASPIFVAFHEGEPIAFLWLAISASTAFELYGGMNEKGQELRANYALKWHAIQKTKEWGISRYDMNGLVSDGVSNFKRGFADHEDMLVGTYDKPLSPLYLIWTKGLPVAKKIVHTLKRK